MNFDAKIEELKVINDEIDQLNEIINEIKTSSKLKNEFEKSKDKFNYLHCVGSFVKLFRFFGISKYETSSGNHLTKYTHFDYKTEMIKEILFIVEKHRDIKIKELESKFSN